jgi:hypothetical protein
MYVLRQGTRFVGALVLGLLALALVERLLTRDRGEDIL